MSIIMLEVSIAIICLENMRPELPAADFKNFVIVRYVMVEFCKQQHCYEPNIK